MTKDALLQQLRSETFVALRPSGIHGIGVFAIRDIPKGTRNIFSHGIGDWIKVSITEVEALPRHSRDLIETYCLFDEDHYYVPDYGFKVMDLVNYLNHSADPNVISVDHGEHFEALRDIKEGEELFVDYHSITDELESYNGS